MNHRQLFNELDIFLNNYLMINNQHIPNEPEPCCDNPRIRYDEVNKVCVSCGRMFLIDDIIIRPQYLNPKYQSTTTIGYGGHKSLYRLHKWTNNDYRENMANRNYKEIKAIGEKLNLNNKVLDNACYIYKTIYIDRNVSSRNKIKRSLYVYCLCKSSYEYKLDFDIIKTLKDNELSIENYNKALLKVVDEKKLFLNPHINTQYEKIIKNWENTKITKKDIILEYNRICRLSKQKKYRLNNNSILLGSIYNLLGIKTDEKKFYKVFNITRTTIKKFNKILN